MTKFYRRGHEDCRCPVTKTAFRNYRKSHPKLTYMEAFRALGGV